MIYTIIQECPQCGAAIEMDETDHLIQCAYCDVNIYLYHPGHHRVLLPHNLNSVDIFYAPYLRFKGAVFLCSPRSIDFRLLDITRAGSSVGGLPASIGLRPQAMRMKTVSSQKPGTYLRLSLETEDFLGKTGGIIRGSASESLLFQTYIGEAVSIIYLPLYIRSNKLFDAIENKAICEPVNTRAFQQAFQCPDAGWAMGFLSTLCPLCGWKLDGERDSIVLTCCNCSSAWEVQNGQFVKLEVYHVPGKDENARYLPFWKIGASFKELEIHTFSDFIRFSRQPRVPRKEWEKFEMEFWCPAFKIRPKNLLGLSTLFTLNQMQFKQNKGMAQGNRYPATLPCGEAKEMIKIILANSMVDKPQILPRISDLQFDIKAYTLVYLPFRENAHEMVQEQIPLAINKNALRFGRQL